jgi:hypothetical protein
LKKINIIILETEECENQSKSQNENKELEIILNKPFQNSQQEDKDLLEFCKNNNF